MNQIISSWVFYLIDVVRKFDTVIMTVLILLGILIVLRVLFWLEDWTCNEDEKRKFFKTTSKIIIAGCVIVLVHTAIPSKETMYTMLVAHCVTYDNVEKATDVIKNSVDYIFDKIDGEQND